VLAWLGLVLVAYLPGALVFRWPTANRRSRAGLTAEERVFWAVVLSVALSCAVTVALAAIGQYRFRTLLLVDVAVSAAIAALGRGRLLFRGEAPRPGWTALAPAALIAVGIWSYFPPSEYIIGGRDPGVYMNQGIRIAQQGSLVIHDPLVSAIPATYRDLFFPPRDEGVFTSDRFLGFFVLDFDKGEVGGQFPQLFPASVAIGYGLDGLTGARRTPGFWALLGLLAVYVAGARFVGPLAAAAGTGLLAIHVLQVWFARCPNAELPMQAVVFAAMLAFTRADTDRDDFFWPVAAILLALLLFLRLDAALVIAAVAGAALLSVIQGRRIPGRFVLPFAGGVALAGWYVAAVTAPYAGFLAGVVRDDPGFAALLGLATALIVASLAAAARWTRTDLLERWLPAAIVLAVFVAAAYAYFLRRPAGLLAPHDALALRAFTAYYLTPYGLAAALLGFALLVRRTFWSSPAFFLTITAFALVFFYKIRIVPEHFWMGRRFLAVFLPGALLCVGAAALWPLWRSQDAAATRAAWPPRRMQVVWLAAGLCFVLLLGRHFAIASEALQGHVEYRGVISHLERLAAHFGTEDLVLVESRAASDLHVLAVPLAYVYGRNVLVLRASRPDPARIAEFLAWARSRYRSVFFLGGSGTHLVSRSIGASGIATERFPVPEYEAARNRYPREVRLKMFDFGVYRFVEPDTGDSFALDVGGFDELHVEGFHDKERFAGSDLTFRWTGGTSAIVVLVTAENRTATLWMSDGGRPADLPRASAAVYLDDRMLGTADLTAAFLPYALGIPPDLARKIAAAGGTASLTIRVSTWSPDRTLGTGDSRELGVMVDRVEIR
jgi:hypothetical protein